MELFAGDTNATAAGFVLQELGGGGVTVQYLQVPLATYVSVVSWYSISHKSSILRVQVRV